MDARTSRSIPNAMEASRKRPADTSCDPVKFRARYSNDSGGTSQNDTSSSPTRHLSSSSSVSVPRSTEQSVKSTQLPNELQNQPTSVVAAPAECTTASSPSVITRNKERQQLSGSFKPQVSNPVVTSNKSADGPGTGLPLLKVDSKTRRIMESSGWPMDILLDPAKQPRVVDTAEEFMEELLFGKHLGEIVVLHNGIEKMKLENSLPKVILEASLKTSNPREFLKYVDKTKPGYLEELKGHIRFYDEEEDHEYTLKRGDKSDKLLENLSEKLQAMEERDDIGENIYITELRKRKKYRHAKDGKWVKTVLTEDVKDVAGPDRNQYMPYWDRWDEGVFVGSHGMGSCMHIDQVLWSNVGKNYTGYKLLAVWPFIDVSNEVMEDHFDTLFRSPFKAKQVAALRKASVVGFVQPGDVFIFSGGCAHMAICLTTKEQPLSITCYESFVNLNPEHFAALMKTKTKEHFEECHVRSKEWGNMREEIADNIYDMLACPDKLPEKHRSKLDNVVKQAMEDEIMCDIVAHSVSKASSVDAITGPAGSSEEK